MPALFGRVLFYLLLSCCIAAVSLNAGRAYSVDLAEPFVVEGTAGSSGRDGRTQTLRALTLLDSPRYPDGFSHFNYADPSAPKRGTLRTAEVGTFHNLAPLIIHQSSVQIWLVYDQLFTSPRDDPLSSYPLIAQSVEIAEDKSFILFHLDPRARWQDGRPVTPEDVVFTFDTLMNHEKALPYYRMVYRDVKGAEAISPHQVKFHLLPGSNKNLPFLIASMHVLPRHTYAITEFGKISLEAPIGSGPYRVGQVLPGRRIVYERVQDYWAQDLPTRRGLYNFDQWIVDYYRNTNAKTQALMAGLSDVVVEFNPRRWIAYDDLPDKAERQLIKVQSRLQGALGSMNFAFNLRRPPFDNRLVREAITQLFDFEWINRVLLGGWAERNDSQFPNSELAAHSRPSAAELELLLPWNGKIRNETLEAEFTLPTSDGRGYQRQQRRRALELFAQAGYVLRDGVLVNAAGKPLAIEILTGNADFENVLLAFVASLRRAGIDARLRIIDMPQFERRTRADFDFDMTFQFFGTTNLPGPEQEFYWGSRFAHERYTVNVPGIEDPVVDDLVSRIGRAASREELIPATRALDRVIAWNGYLLPGWYMAFAHYAYWDRFGRADHRAGREAAPELGSPAIEAWWIK
ncbi:extracellular solute-binding protein (plasmid) [Skermanella mucosa]|uniref:extracellular solute-binding protein n=1 Tax=Skermanella mucosa TaxID=1789672 RepID=UPI00192C1F88|nr:extracellular solute-binding protein [Skermanella mucosa]UEM24300.1 extracellular solute-binding protein [Skermanella mucosa]